ncbi:hypothetical protein PC121_g9426 [Phytophthora cactorum]|nr:hypothetical protein PC121_g9426 [Phytophthora cactorum]
MLAAPAICAAVSKKECFTSRRSSIRNKRFLVTTSATVVSCDC